MHPLSAKAVRRGGTQLPGRCCGWASPVGRVLNALPPPNAVCTAQITLDYMKGNDKMDDMLAARCRRGIEHARRRVVRLRVCASPCQRAAGLTLTRSSCDVVCVVVDLRQRAERMLNWAAARIACQQAGLASLRRRGVRSLVYIIIYILKLKFARYFSENAFVLAGLECFARSGDGKGKVVSNAHGHVSQQPLVPAPNQSRHKTNDVGTMCSTGCAKRSGVGCNTRL